MTHWLVSLGMSMILVPGGAAITQDDATTARQFLGMWRLVGWTQRAADGTNRPGQTDVGYLVYTDVNRMCAVMMDSTRPKWPTGAPANVDDAMSRFSRFISYCAAVEVHAKDGFVLHHVDIERSPNVVGTTRKRWFQFEGPNRLVLRIDRSELGTGLTESTLTWERVQK
jgi:hypothetical protein